MLTVSLVFLLSADFLRINIYLTQKMNEDMFWNIAINGAEAEYDPLTLLRTRTYYGRPDWKTIYLSLRTSIHSGVYLPQANDNPKVTTVRTFFCGPSVMAKVIQAEAGAASTPSVKFTFFKVSRGLFVTCDASGLCSSSHCLLLGTLLIPFGVGPLISSSVWIQRIPRIISSSCKISIACRFDNRARFRFHSLQPKFVFVIKLIKTR